jgi:hypothetical protein
MLCPIRVNQKLLIAELTVLLIYTEAALLQKKKTHTHTHTLK